MKIWCIDIRNNIHANTKNQMESKIEMITYVPNNSLRLYLSSIENCLSGSRESRFDFLVESFLPNNGIALEFLWLISAASIDVCFNGFFFCGSQNRWAKNGEFCVSRLAGLFNLGCYDVDCMLTIRFLWLYFFYFCTVNCSQCMHSRTSIEMNALLCCVKWTDNDLIICDCARNFCVRNAPF